jgi:hypothetical protein
MGLLERVSRGKVAGPVRLVVYGAGGVGKSTFAAGAPSPLFFDFESRTGHLDVARVRPTSWDDVLGTLRELYAAPGEFRTLVFDTLDHMELLLHAHVCKTNGWTSIEDPAYGKGYIPALHEWAKFLGAVERLQVDKGLNVIMLAHAQMLPFKNPAGEDYNMFSLKLKGGAKTSASDLIREKVDLIGFARWEDFAKKANPKDQLTKAKAITTGARVLSFAHNPAYESKKGIPMADEIQLSWGAFEAAVKDKS